MNKKVGLWIDHCKAVIVTVADGKEKIKQVQSNIQKSARQPSEHARSTDDGPEDQRDRAFMGHLDRYYDKVIAHMGDAESVLIFGPGKAKEEFKRRLESKVSPGCKIVLEAIDKMTDWQIKAKVIRYFPR